MVWCADAPSKKPKKAILDYIDETISLNSDGNDILIGELKTMKAIVEGTTGKPKTVELEKLIYINYWRRLREIHSQMKKNNKKKK